MIDRLISREKLGAHIHSSIDDLSYDECCDVSMTLADLCESPIEVLLGGAILVGFNAGRYPDFISLPPAFGKNAVLIPQYKWENYRIDFAICQASTSRPFIFIECDGHDFHERTKDQAAHDRKKDRQIQNSGMSILRFTGSEIYNDLYGCADQIVTFMDKNVARIADLIK